jgi:hypothetical protein
MVQSYGDIAIDIKYVQSTLLIKILDTENKNFFCIISIFIHLTFK